MPVPLSPNQSMDPYSSGMSAGTDNIFEAYLGQPSRSKVNPLAGRNVTTWNMDEAYDGESLSLQQTILDWMWTKNRTWYTEVILPWRVTDQIYVEWDRWEANAHIMGVTPHQATGRLISQRRSTHRAALVRRSLALQIENDWAETRRGRESIVMAIGQFADSYQETANAEVIRALLHAHHYQQQYVRETGQVRRLDHIEYLRRQRDNFARVQKDKNGLDLWDDETDAEAHIYRGMFDSIIVSDRMLSYVTMVRPEKTDFYMTGREGLSGVRETLNKGAIVAESPQQRIADRVEPRLTFNGKNVYQARAFHVEGVQPVELLAKTVQIGEYNWMTNERCNYSDGKYRSDMLDIMVYDEDKDRYAKLTARACLAYCGLFDQQGNVLPAMSTDGGETYNEADVARDFLMRYDPRSGKYTTVQFIGDIGDVFLTEQELRNTADSLYYSVFQTDADRAAADAAVGDAIEFGRDAQNRAEISVPRANVFPNNTRLTAIFGTGEDNLFFGANGPTFTVNSFIGGNLIPLYKGTRGNDLPAPQSHAWKFLTMAKGIVPTEADKARIDSLYQESASKADFIEQLGDFLRVAAIGNHQGGFNSVQEFNNYYTPRATQQFLNNPKIVMERNVGQREVVFGRAGAPLPEGHEYVNPEDAHRMDEGWFPSNVGDILKMNNKVTSERAAEEQEPGMMYEQQGFHQVGTMYGFGANDEGIATMKETYDGSYSGAPGDDPVRYQMMNKHLQVIKNSGMSPARKILAAIYLGARVTRGLFEKFLTYNVALPNGFLILRPHATYRGRIALKVLSGGGAGYTYFGHGRAEIGHDASRMITLMHSAAYMAAIVDHSENVWAEGNLMVDRYYGGLGMRFFTPETYQQRRPQGNAESIIVIAVPASEKEFPVPLDIAGRYYVDYDNGLIDQAQNNELHYSTALRYDTMYGFYSRADAVDELTLATVLPDDVHYNRICWPGAQFSRGPSGNFDHYEYNQSPWGPMVYPGVAEVRNGARKYLDGDRMTQLIQSVR